MGGNVLWPAKPHTLAKIEIVREYLKAWFPILGRRQRVVYIDGFSGPGMYAGGELGSPIVALETAINHPVLRSFHEIVFIFIEKDTQRSEHLKSMINRYDLPDNIKVMVENNDFDEALQSVLAHVEGNGLELAPTFLFIDPFGVKGVKMDRIRKFMENPKCEFLLNFMADPIRRFNESREFEEHIDNLFGEKGWRECLDIDTSSSRFLCLVNKFETSLNGFLRYHWKVEMFDERNKCVYYLYFGTNNILGLEKMKDAMWKIVPTGDYAFRSIASNQDDQISLFDDYVDYDKLVTSIYSEFNSNTARIEEIETYVITKTNYRKQHTKQALRKLEVDGRLDITNRRRKMSYPPNTIIKFV